MRNYEMTETPEPERRLALMRASSIKSVRPKWLWNGRIPSGTITIFAGRGGEGKSTFALYLTALLNAGQLEGDQHGVTSTALIISHEDDWGTVMVPRLKAAGANLDLVVKMSVETRIDETTLEHVPAFPMDGDKLREAIKQTGAKLVIIDPIPSTIGGDLHKVADVRRALDPLAVIAQELDVAIIGVMHFNKGSGNASDKLSGSHAFRDAVRSVMLFATDEDTGQRVVTIDKSNYSTARGESFAFNLVSETVYTDDGEQTEVGRVEYLGDTDLDVESIINRQPGGDDDHEDRNAAQAFIVSYLEKQDDREGIAGEILKAGRAAGFTDNEIKHARKRSKNPRIESRKASFGGGWVWALDLTEHQGANQGAQDATISDPGTFGTFVAPSHSELAIVTPIGGQK